MTHGVHAAPVVVTVTHSPDIRTASFHATSLK